MDSLKESSIFGTLMMSNMYAEWWQSRFWKTPDEFATEIWSPVDKLTTVSQELHDFVLKSSGDKCKAVVKMLSWSADWWRCRSIEHSSIIDDTCLSADNYKLDFKSISTSIVADEPKLVLRAFFKKPIV